MNNPQFEIVKKTNPTVYKILSAGGTLEDCIVQLAGQNDFLQKLATELKLIAPRRIKTPDGKIMVWRCPNDLIPIEHMVHAPEAPEEVQSSVTKEDEELVQQCLEIMRREKQAATSLFQRRLRLGYIRATRLLEILEERGFVGPGDGAKPREILRYE